jgi:hypothetical protein
LKSTVNHKGYRVISLPDAGGRRQWSLHRVVLRAFRGECPAGMEACHNNGVRQDCQLSNLRWDTHVNNMADQLAHGTRPMKERNPRSIVNSTIAGRIIDLLASGMFQKEVAAVVGVSQQSVSLVKRGEHWAAQGRA